MPSRRLTARIAAGSTLAITATALAVAAPASQAAKVLPADITANPRGGHVEYGTVTLKLSGGAASKLKSAGGKFSASGTGKIKGSSITFDADKASVIDPTVMRGSLVFEGDLTVKGKSKTAKLKDFTLEPGLKKRVTAKIGSKLVELGSLKGGKTTFGGYSDGTLSGAKFALSGSGAKALNKATGGGFSSGTFATVGAAITTIELPMASGTATMTLDPALLKILTDNGNTITPEAPATYADGVITIPLTGGAFDPENLTGRLALEGKIRVGNAERGVPLFGWRAAIGGGQNELYAGFNEGSSGAAAVIADVDVSKMTITLEGKNYSAVGGTLRLGKTATDILKQQFNITLPPGTPMGTVNLNGLLSS